METNILLGFYDKKRVHWIDDRFHESLHEGFQIKILPRIGDFILLDIPDICYLMERFSLSAYLKGKGESFWISFEKEEVEERFFWLYWELYQNFQILKKPLHLKEVQNLYAYSLRLWTILKNSPSSSLWLEKQENWLHIRVLDALNIELCYHRIAMNHFVSF